MFEFLRNNFFLFGILIASSFSILLAIIHKTDGQKIHQNVYVSLKKKEYEEYKHESESAITNTVIGISDSEINSHEEQLNSTIFLDKEIRVGNHFISREGFSLKRVGEI